MNPFISFCLYVAARVFVQYLKSRPKDTQIRASLQFLLQAMQAIKRKNPLTESFLVQLDVDLEGAGIENTADLRTNAQNPKPFAPTRAEACPSEHLVMGHQTTYGDLGLSSYNDPNSTSNLTSTAPSQPSVPSVQSSFGYTDLSNMNEEHHMGFMASSEFSLPNRQRSPASGPSSGMHRSPQEMDVSPGASTGEHRTPNSSSHQSQQNLSAHTSHTGYSPQNMQQSSNEQPTPGRLGASLFNPNDAAFSTDFDMHSFPTSTADNQPPGFVLPSNWGSSGTGLTPGPTGMTPGTGSGFTPSGTGFTPGPSGMNDMINMSDADWQSMMDSMGFQPDWETGVGHAESLQSMMNNRRM